MTNYPFDEKARQAAVESYQLIDTLPEKSYDDITSIAAFICDTPIALITMLDYDRNFLKSHYGVAFKESPRKISFCTHAIQSNEEIFIIKDSRKDNRFRDNPLVTGDVKAIFYAGVPLIDKNKHALGTLCVFDHKPRILNAKQKKALIALAHQVVNLFELRKQNFENKKLQENLIKKNDLLKDFAGVVSHDMKMPLANIITTSDLLKARYKEILDKKGLQYLNYLKSSSFSLSEYITGILQHYESDNLTIAERETFDLNHLLEDVEDLLNIEYSSIVNYPTEEFQVSCNRAALNQIFINLLSNSIKYNDKEYAIIDVDCKENNHFYYFDVKDNSKGIPEEKKNKIFELFETASETDRNGNRGNGIGLSTVKKIVTNLGGDIEVKSIIGQGSTFSFSIAKNNIPF